MKIMQPLGGGQWPVIYLVQMSNGVEVSELLSQTDKTRPFSY